MVEVAIRQPQLPNSHMNTEGGVLISSVSVMAARNLVSLGTLRTDDLTNAYYIDSTLNNARLQ